MSPTDVEGLARSLEAYIVSGLDALVDMRTMPLSRSRLEKHYMAILQAVSLAIPDIDSEQTPVQTPESSTG